MDCKHIEKLLGRYMDGGLDSGLETALREHIAECAACAQQFDAMERIKNGFSQMEDEPVPIGFEQRWKQRILEPQPEKKVFFKQLPALAAGAAAIAIIGAVLATGVLNQAPPKLAGMEAGTAPQAAAGSVQMYDASLTTEANMQESVMMAPAPDTQPAASAASSGDAASSLQMKAAADMAAPISVQVSADTLKKIENAFLSIDSVQIEFTSADGYLTVLITEENSKAVSAIIQAEGLDLSPQAGETYDFISAE